MRQIHLPSSSRLNIPSLALTGLTMVALWLPACAHDQQALSPNLAAQTGPTSSAGSQQAGPPAAASKSSAPSGPWVEIQEEHASYVFETATHYRRHYQLKLRCRNQACVEQQQAQTIGYDGENDAPPKVILRVDHPDGTHEEQTEAGAQSQVVRPAALGQGPELRSLRLQLRSVQVGDVISLTIDSERTVPFGPVASGAYSLASASGTGSNDFSLEFPESLPLVTKTLGAAPAPVVSSEGGRKTLHYHLDRAPEFEQVGMYEATPRPSGPMVLFSVGGNWQALAAALATQVEKVLAPDAATKTRFKIEGKALARAGKTPLQRLRLLVSGVQSKVHSSGAQVDVRSLKRGPLFAAWDKGEDSALGRALLTLGLARGAGFEAQLALVRAWHTDLDWDPQLPGLVFERALIHVTAPIEAWVDPVANFVPAGQLPPETAGQLALVLDPKTTAARLTPALKAEDNHYQELRKQRFAEFGPGFVDERSTATGWIGANMRAFFSPKSPIEQQSWGRDYLKKTYLSDNLNTLRISGLEAHAPVFKLQVGGNGCLAVNAVSDEVGVKFGLGAFWESFPSKLIDLAGKLPPTTPLRIPKPYQAEVTNLVALPAGFVPVKLPKTKVWTEGSTRLERHVELKGQTLLYSLRFDSGDGRLLASEALALDKAAGELLPPKGWLIAPNRGVALVKAGQLKLGFERLRAERKAAPDALGTGLRMVNALIEAGLGFAAVPLAQSVAAAHPTAYRALATLGRAEEQAFSGENRGLGFDRDAALAAYRKAVALAPKERDPQRRLAYLLEVDAEGLRRTDGKGLEEAVALERKMAKALGDHSLDARLRGNLFWLGQDEEVLKIGPVNQKDGAFDPVGFVSELLLGRKPDAIVEAVSSASGSTPKERSARLGTLGALCLGRGAYAEASRFFDAAASLPGANRAVGYLASLTRMAAVPEAKRPPLPGPAKEALGLMVAMMYDDLSSAKDQRRLARWYGPVMETEADLEASIKDLQEMLHSSGLKLRKIFSNQLVGIDISASVMKVMMAGGRQVHVEGSEALGYKVSGTQGASEGKTTLFLWKGRAGWQNASLGKSPKSLARQALKLHKAGLAKARDQWLQWTFEAIPKPAHEAPMAYLPGFTLALAWKGDQPLKGEYLRQVLAMIEGDPDAKWVASLPKPLRLGAQLAALRATANEAQLLKARDKKHAQRKGQPGKQVQAAWTRLRDGAEALLKDTELPEMAEMAARVHLGRAEVELGQFDEALVQVEALLKLDPKNLGAIYRGADLRFRLQGAQAAFDFVNKLWEEQDQRPEMLNNLAWLALLAGEPLQPWIDRAQQAFSKNSASAADLHTLATLQAEAGHPAAALAALRRSVKAELRSQVDREDWYVLGRVAESVGLIEEARESYAKVLVDPSDRPQDTSVLAKRALARLGAEAAPAAASSLQAKHKRSKQSKRSKRRHRK